VERKIIKVFLNDPDNVGKRKEVEAEVISYLPTTMLVKLPNGNIISRKKKRDLLPV